MLISPKNLRIKNIKLFCTLSAGLLLLCSAGCIRDDEPEEKGLQAGESLPEFTVTLANGEVISNDGFNGRQGAILFFSLDCADCKRELPRMESAYRTKSAESSGDDFIFLCISRDDSREAIENYWLDNDVTMPVAAESRKDIYSMFAESGVSRLYIVENGIIKNLYLEYLPSELK